MDLQGNQGSQGQGQVHRCNSQSFHVMVMIIKARDKAIKVRVKAVIVKAVIFKTIKVMVKAIKVRVKVVCQGAEIGCMPCAYLNHCCVKLN